MNQKKMIVLTLALVIGGTVIVNEVIVRRANGDQNREVASSVERFQPEQIKWEQELAKTVSQDSQARTVIGAKPTLSEKFLYEALEGRYEAQVVAGKILKISLMPNREAVDLNMETVMSKYSSVFKDAKKFDRQVASEGRESIKLQSGDSKDIGLVTIQRNAQGRILTIEIQ